MGKRYGFEAHTAEGWSQEAAGYQDAGNTFASLEEAQALLPALAAALGCSVESVRVTTVEV